MKNEIEPHQFSQEKSSSQLFRMVVAFLNSAHLSPLMRISNSGAKIKIL